MARGRRVAKRDLMAEAGDEGEEVLDRIWESGIGIYCRQGLAIRDRCDLFGN